MSTREFRRLTNVDEAMRLFYEAIGSVTVDEFESVKVEDALGRVLAKRVIARSYLPTNDIAVVDGFAVNSADLRHASTRNPVVLRLAGESKLGEFSRVKVRRGETAAVATGSIVPRAADAVVMIEQARPLSGNRVKFHQPVSQHQGLTRKGEDLKPGRSVLGKRSRLRPEDLGVLKALGLRKVQVRRRVRVGVLSTGNELVNAVGKRKSAKIVDLNRTIIGSMLTELGTVAVDLGIVKDDARAIKARLKTGLARTDLVLVTAGSSVGKRDLVPDCINSLGKPGMVVHGVAMRPAMPTGLAVVRGKPVVSLPGFPVSAMIAFRVFVKPLLARLVGAPQVSEQVVRAVLGKNLSGTKGLRTFVRVSVEKAGCGYVAVPLRAQRSSMLTSMVDANGIVTLLESTPFVEAGTEVSVALTDDLAA